MQNQAFTPLYTQGETEQKQRPKIDDHLYIEDNSIGLGLGYDINEYLAVEASYHDYGKGEEEYYSFLDMGENRYYTELSSDSFNISIKGKYPIISDLNLSLSLGATRWQHKKYTRVPGNNEQYTSTYDNNKIFLAYGLHYQLSEKFGVGLEKYTLRDDKPHSVFYVKNTALYLSYHF